MKKYFISGILVCLMAIGSIEFASANMYEAAMLTPSSIELRTSMRKLWEDHITYTRNYIISDLANLGDKSKIAERLLRNQSDIGDAIKPIYGDEAGNKLTSLLKEHIIIATKVVEAAKAANKGKKKKNKNMNMNMNMNENKSQMLEKTSDEWKKNGEEIAIFLSGANPNWNQDQMKEMLEKHLTFTIDEVTSRLKKNWGMDIEAYDKGHEHMLMFADELTIGIVKQFPDKFKN